MIIDSTNKVMSNKELRAKNMIISLWKSFIGTKHDNNHNEIWIQIDTMNIFMLRKKVSNFVHLRVGIY